MPSCPTLPPRAARIAILMHDLAAGGTECVALRLAGAWTRMGRSVTILCGEARGPASAHLPDGVALVEQQPPIPRGPGSRVRLGRAVAQDLRRGARFDVVVGPGNFHLIAMAALAGALAPEDRPALVCKLSNPLRRPQRGALGEWLVTHGKRRLVRGIDSLTAMSDALCAEARSVLGRDDITTLPEPIVAGGAAEPEPALGAGGPLILVAGRLVAQKRIGLALRAFAMLGLPEARLVVLGDGPERAALETLASRLSLRSRCRFVGHVPDIRPWLARADLLLSTSRFEGYPAVLIEALAAGVPVVATRSSVAIDEILCDPTRGMVAESEAMALGAAMARTLSRGRVPDAERDAVRAAHAVDRCAALWLDHLDQLVAARVR